MATLRLIELGTLDRIASEIRSTTDPAHLRDRLGWLLEAHHLVNFELRYSRCYWRARICRAGEPFQDLSEMGLPPSSVVSAGRLNQPGKPVLYVTPNQFSAIAEVGAEVGDLVQFLAYEFKEDKKLCCGVLGEVERVSRWGTSFSTGGLPEALNELLNKLDFEGCSSFVYMDAFLASLMRDRSASENEYLHSRTLAELLFNVNKHVQALLYSGTAAQGAMNLAIDPAAAEEVLSPKASLLLRITEKFGFSFCRFSVEGRTSSIADNGRFVWSES